MPIFSAISTFIDRHALIQPNSTIVVGLSGGPDSVFLLHILARIKEEKKLTLIAAHLDHGWRAESAQDVLFCKNVSAQLSIPFVHDHAHHINLHVKFNGSKEEVGRKLRRHFFEKVAQNYGASAIALAHHADDQQETFFIRLIRGSTLTGLTGIKPKDGLYVRPLLELSKPEIMDYLDQHRIPYVIDSTNNSPDFLRNRIRATVIPAVKAVDSRFNENFKNTVEKLGETEAFLTMLTHTMFEEIRVKDETRIVLNLQQLLALDPFLQQRIVVLWLCQEKVPFTLSDAFIKEIIRFVESPHGGEHAMNIGWSVVKKKNMVWIKHT